MVRNPDAPLTIARALLVVACLVLGACGSSEADTPAEQAAGLDDFRFSGEALDGSEVDTWEVIGTRPVAFWVWAPWCPTCNREAPTVRAVADRYGDRVTFIGVPGRDNTAPMRVFVERHELEGFPHVVDTDGSLWSRLGVPGQPAWVLVGVDGSVQRRFGLVDEEVITHDIDEMLAVATQTG